MEYFYFLFIYFIFLEWGGRFSLSSCSNKTETTDAVCAPEKNTAHIPKKMLSSKLMKKVKRGQNVEPNVFPLTSVFTLSNSRLPNKKDEKADLLYSKSISC